MENRLYICGQDIGLKSDIVVLLKVLVTVKIIFNGCKKTEDEKKQKIIKMLARSNKEQKYFLFIKNQELNWVLIYEP